MRCVAKTKNGKRCKNTAVYGSTECHVHLKKSSFDEDNIDALYFKDALYYPFIEITNEPWLKTACLYWDSISTIVPSRMKAYRSETSRLLRDAEILHPLIVDPDLPELDEVTDEVVLFLDSPEGQKMVSSASKSPRDRINVEKFSNKLRYASMHGNKFSRGLLRNLHSLGVTGRSSGRWINIPRPFAHYYMTILATNLARHKGRALLTDTVLANELANKSMLGDLEAFGDKKRKVPGKIAEGVLANLVLRTINLGPKTSVKKIIKFREKQYAELGNFRMAIRELVKSLSSDIDPNVLCSHISTIYTDKVVPTISDLRGRLRDNGISCGYNNLKLSTLVSASPTILGFILAKTSLGPFALAAGVGLSVVLSAANYRLKRRDILRNNPFSYIIIAEKKFGKKAV